MKRDRTAAYIKGLWTRIKSLSHALELEKKSGRNAEIRRRLDIDQARSDMRGTLVASWADGILDAEMANSAILGNLKAGDHVAVIGRVVKTQTSLDEDGNLRSSFEFHRKQTRKVPIELLG